MRQFPCDVYVLHTVSQVSFVDYHSVITCVLGHSAPYISLCKPCVMIDYLKPENSASDAETKPVCSYTCAHTFLLAYLI